MATVGAQTLSGWGCRALHKEELVVSAGIELAPSPYAFHRRHDLQ